MEARLGAWVDRRRSLAEEFPAQQGVEARDRVVGQAALADLGAEERAAVALLRVVAEVAVALEPVAVRVGAAPRLRTPPRTTPASAAAELAITQANTAARLLA